MTWIALYESLAYAHEFDNALMHMRIALDVSEWWDLSHQWTGRKPKVSAYVKVPYSAAIAGEWMKEHFDYGFMILKSKPNLRYFERFIK